MRVLITTNKEAAHDYFVKKIVESFPQVSFLVIRQGKKQNKIKFTLIKLLASLQLDRFFFRSSPRRLEIDKFRKFKKYFPSNSIDRSINQFDMDINSHESKELLSELPCDGIIVLGGKIIKIPILSLIKDFSLHLHCGIVPFYRGGTTWFSNFSFEDFNNCGFTIQLLDEGIDTGSIITQQQIIVAKGDTVWDAYCKCIVAGTDALIELLNRKASNLSYSFAAEPVSCKGFNHTGRFLFERNRLRRAARKMIAKTSTDGFATGLLEGELPGFEHEYVFSEKYKCVVHEIPSD
jgi:hypothetical protein